jgi:hypothetical protein
MLPSESAVGKAWLSNFHTTELPAATILLDRLRFVSFGGLWTGLLDLLRSLESEGQLTPFVVYPERPLDVPGAPLEIPAGSDSFVAMVLKELQALGSEPVGGIATHASLEELRSRRCRAIVLATDIVASGEQIEQLAAAVSRNRTIRSWRSFGWVQIRVAAFAIMQDGLDRLTESPFVDGVDYVEQAPTIWSVPLAEEIRDEVVRLCIRHASGYSPLGFLDTGALFATQRRAPDNVPGVLIRPSSSSWHALFSNRSVPSSFAAEVGDFRGREPLQEVAERLGQLRLGRNHRVSSVRSGSRALLQAMTIASGSALSADALAQSLGTERSTAESLLSSLMSWGFVDADGTLTDTGRREISEYKRGRRWTTAQLEGDDAHYYHHGVR